MALAPWLGVPPQIQALLWAQWRASRNVILKGSKAAPVIAGILSLLWYGLWVLGAVSLCLVCAKSSIDLLLRVLPPGLFLALMYWQIVPIILAATGYSLELKKIIIYPIPHSQLFMIEVLLRISGALEMILMVSGSFIGLLCNPAVPFWAPFGMLLFAALNLLLSTGLRDLIGRLLSGRRTREVMMIAVVILGALPQLALRTGGFQVFRHFKLGAPSLLFPWTATADFVLGRHALVSLMSMLVWTLAAFVFSRYQFERTLTFDASAERATTQLKSKRSVLGFVFRLPGHLFKDPLGILIEKELRFAVRSARFRLVFMMGFSFGLLVWLPLLLRPNQASSPLGSHALTAVSLYALMLLGEVCIWNVFGFDRRAVQIYFALPVPFRTVLIAKNLASLLFVLIETLVITLVCLLLRMPLTLNAFAECVCMVMVTALFFISVGNVTSVRSPRPVNPDQSWKKSSASKVQAFMLLLYPLVAIPVLLAFAARYAFDSNLAFYVVVLIDLLAGLALYSVALDSALEWASGHKEQVITLLSQGEGPVS